MKKFWNWIRDDAGVRTLRMEGPIDEESYWGDEVVPKAFREELNAEEGDIILWLNSPGGNVFAASEIYSMLKDYKGSVTVKIDAIAASAASVVAMAGDRVLISPTGLVMIHDPSTVAQGNAKDMEHAITVLGEVKESIINAYMAKTGLSHSRISNLMSQESWMNAKKAVELGFADEILFTDEKKPDEDDDSDDSNDADPDEDEEKEEEGDKPLKLSSRKPYVYSARQMQMNVLNRLGVDFKDTGETRPPDGKPPEGEPSKPPEGEPPAGDPPQPPDGENPPDGKEPPTHSDTPEQAGQDEPSADSGAAEDSYTTHESSIPVIGLDGRTQDGSIPYLILKEQLECLR